MVNFYLFIMLRDNNTKLKLSLLRKMVNTVIPRMNTRWKHNLNPEELQDLFLCVLELKTII